MHAILLPLMEAGERQTHLFPLMVTFFSQSSLSSGISILSWTFLTNCSFDGEALGEDVGLLLGLVEGLDEPEGEELGLLEGLDEPEGDELGLLEGLVDPEGDELGLGEGLDEDDGETLGEDDRLLFQE